MALLEDQPAIGPKQKDIRRAVPETLAMYGERGAVPVGSHQRQMYRRTRLTSPNASRGLQRHNLKDTRAHLLSELLDIKSVRLKLTRVGGVVPSSEEAIKLLKRLKVILEQLQAHDQHVRVP